ncbi:hypothetical protein RJT34_23991 [Clitoria ternatea]|uniref:F-box protein n=1 Tax=Clitoria ternatea TaxID=43366 RepID=A0AAN9IIV9_CLITE
METPSKTLSPPWEALILVATYLDAKTLAISSCVSKSWFSSMSSDHIWKPILATHFPSLSTLPPSTAPSHRLFAIAQAAAKRRRQKLTKPNLSLADLIFTISICSSGSRVISTAEHCDTLFMDPPGVFRFRVSWDGVGLEEGVKEMKVMWNVVLKGWRGVFTMMEFEGKVHGGEMCGGGGGGVNKVSVGILSVVNWRYVDLEDGLRYLQHFLLSCNAL